MEGSRRSRGPNISDSGIILRYQKLGESDRILRILTKEHGKRSAVAKGVRKPKSSFGARLEPFTCSRLLLYEGRNMDIVRQAEIEVSFHELRQDLELFTRASAMSELIDKITVEHDPHPELFSLLLKGFELLKNKAGQLDFILSFFEYRVLAESGLGLRVGECANCGGSYSRGSFSLKLGGFVCANCRDSIDVGKIVTVSDVASETLRWMSENELGSFPEELDESVIREISFLMEKVMEHWLEREFRSHRTIREVSHLYGKNKN